MPDDDSMDKTNQPGKNQDENLKDNELDNDNAVNNEGTRDQEEINAASEEPQQGTGEDTPVEDKTTTIDIKKDKHIGEEEKKSNKKVFIIAGIAIILTIILIIILLLFMFCKNTDIPDSSAITTVAVEQTIDNSGDNQSSSGSSSSESSSDVTEETSKPTEETTAQEVIEETPETEATTESVATIPTISLAIIEGPIYSSADDVCFYRVEATVTGNPKPAVVNWSKNDTASYGPYVAQVNLTTGSPTYTLTGTVTNSAGSATDSITLSWGCNRPPDVTAINIPSEVSAGSSNSVSAVATDPDGDVLSYSWTVNGGSLNNAGINPTNWTVPTTPGSYRITVTVSDGKGGTDTMSKNINVISPNRPPTVSDIYVKDHSTQASASYAVTGLEYDLSVNASDSDGDTLNFSWSLSGSINPGSLGNSHNNPASWSAPYSSAWVTITVVVDDGNGGTVSRSRQIEVRYGVY